MTTPQGGPIRIAHTSDLHIDERGRLDDVRAVLDAMLEDMLEQEVDLIIVAGDHFERRSTPTERVVLADFIQRAAEVAPVFCVRGNHDAPRDLEVFGRLVADSLVHIFERPTVAPGSAPVFPIGGGRMLGLLALPWFDKAHLVAGLDAQVDQNETRVMTIEAARGLLTLLRAEADRIRGLGAVPILAGHVMVGGSVVSSGQTLIGTSVELSPADILDVGAVYAALGHVHATQVWHGGRVAYSGSPHRCNYGEREAKGYRLVTIEDGEFVENEFRELPARRMVFVEGDVSVDGNGNQSIIHNDQDFKGALVRVRIRVRSELLHTVDEEWFRATLMERGAAEVKVETVVEVTTRARAPEVVSLQTLPEKLDAYLAAKGIPVDEAARPRLHEKLGVIEREVSDATA